MAATGHEARRDPESDVSQNTRTETDSIGAIEVPADAYWGAQTQRSIENFPFGTRERMPIGIVRALAIVKQAAARVNVRHGLADQIGNEIEEAAAEIVAGKFDDQFPLVIWQTGSGTQSNMNVNEVIAGIANERLGDARGGKSPVHPNDHVNMSQSSNDSFPTALHVAAALAVHATLLPALDTLHAAIDTKAQEWRRYRQDRAHAPAGCDAADAGAGVLRLCAAVEERARADREHRALQRHAAGAGRDGGGHRAERA